MPLCMSSPDPARASGASPGRTPRAGSKQTQVRQARQASPLCYVLTGVSGSGKSTVGKLLAERLQCRFFDGDDYHSKSNIDKMRRQVPLTDADREPWLATLAQILEDHVARSELCVLACSCLKLKYRRLLMSGANSKASPVGPDDILFVLLRPTKEELQRRLGERRTKGGHFMPPELLDSQLETLEVDADARVFESASPTAIVDALAADRLKPSVSRA